MAYNTRTKFQSMPVNLFFLELTHLNGVRIENNSHNEFGQVSIGFIGSRGVHNTSAIILQFRTAIFFC